MINTILPRAQEQSEQEHFDSMAERYDKNYTYNTEFTRYKIQKKLDTLFGFGVHTKKISILEIGAGTGEYTLELAKRFPNATILATDISPKILRVAKEKCRGYTNIQFEVCSAYDLPYAKRQFDIVCGFYILHHLSLQEAMPEIARVLKLRGLALFYEPNILNPIVAAIKSIPYLKKLAGDSEYEWAINPLSISRFSYLFEEYRYIVSEFIVIPSVIPLSIAKLLDNLTSYASLIPGISLLGGSVAIKLKK